MPRRQGALNSVSKRAVTRTRQPSRRATDPETPWVRQRDEQLLNWRLCDLRLGLAGSELDQRIQRLYAELRMRHIDFEPHCWLSEEWFTPDGIPGIAIPFYLAHPRLMRLEKRQMLEVEGGTEEWCLRILRHEAGHAIDNAYRLHCRRKWTRVFGRYTQPYPESYQAKPYSKSYVLHLDPWYSQSHPAEDFAETFAVWLKPRSRWRTQYQGWPAKKKLEYVDELMSEIAGTRPLVKSRRQVDPIAKLKKTLAEYYADKRSRYAVEVPDFYDRELRRLFSDAPEHRRNPSAAAFLRRIRPELRRVVAKWTGQYQYIIDEILREIIERTRALNLRLECSPARAKQEALVMVTAQAMNYLQRGHHRFAL
jgi:hypothetical protein